MLADIDEIFCIDKLKIMNFRGLYDIPAFEFKLMNVICSPGNFGKTSILMAIALATDYDNYKQILKVADSFCGSKEKTFEKFVHMLKKCDNRFLYEIYAEFGGFELYKRMSGEVKRSYFYGEYFSNIKNKKLSLDGEIRASVELTGRKEEIPTKCGIARVDFAYFDFAGNYNCDILPYKNEIMQKIIEDYILSFEDNIERLYVKNKRFYVEHSEFGECTCDILGSSLLKCLEFSDFCDKNQEKILLIDNADSAVSPDVYRIFAKMLLTHLINADSQFFISAKDRKFGEILIEIIKEADLYGQTSYIDIYRDDDGIAVKNIVGKFEDDKQIINSSH